MKRRVAVTGIGAVTPLGNTAPATWEGVRTGACGIGPITQYDTSRQKVTLAGEVVGLAVDELIDRRAVRKMDRVTQFGLIAGREAVADSGIDLSRYDSARCGVLVSTGIGGLSTIEREYRRGLEKGFDKVSPYFIPMAITNITAGTLAIELGLHGPCACPVTACAGGANAIGEGFRAIRDGYADVMLCGGSEASITPLGMGGFTSLRALSECADPERASIPFDKERSGFVMGEGAGLLVLEDYDAALSRGAHIYGEVTGFAATCDAHHITAPCPDGSGAATCMELALRDGDTRPEEVDYINAHGTSTPMNDRCETLAIKAALGEQSQRVAVSSTKSMMGHLLGASGAVEAIVTLMALREGFIPPTINYRVPDGECDLDIVPNVGRARALFCALSNSLGFGGHNATLLFRSAKGA